MKEQQQQQQPEFRGPLPCFPESSELTSLQIQLPCRACSVFMGEKVKARAVKRKKKKSVRKCPLASSGGCLVSSLFVPSLCSLSLSPYQQVHPSRARGVSAGEGDSAAGCLPCGAPGRYPLKEGLKDEFFVYVERRRERSLSERGLEEKKEEKNWLSRSRSRHGGPPSSSLDAPETNRHPFPGSEALI